MLNSNLLKIDRSLYIRSYIMFKQLLTVYEGPSTKNVLARTLRNSFLENPENPKLSPSLFMSF